MALYAQQVEGGTGVESPTAQVDYSGASRIGAAIGSLFGSPATGGGSGQSQDDQRQGQLQAFLFEEAERARAMMEQGDPALARAKLNQSRIAALNEGLVINAAVIDQLEAITGTSETMFLQSPTEQAVAELLRTEQGQGFLVLAAMELGGDATQEDVHALALTMSADYARNEQILQENRVAGERGAYAWNNGGHAAFEENVFKLFQDGVMGRLYDMMKRGIHVNERDVQEARNTLSLMVAAKRPSNLNAEQNAALDARINSINIALDGLEKALDPQEIMGMIVDLKIQYPQGVMVENVNKDVIEAFGNYLDYNQSDLLEPNANIMDILEPAAIAYVEQQKKLRDAFEGELALALITTNTAADAGVLTANSTVPAETMNELAPTFESVEEAVAGLGKLNAGVGALLGQLDDPVSARQAVEHVAGLGAFLWGNTEEIDAATINLLFGPTSPLAIRQKALLEAGGANAASANAVLRTGIQVQQRAVSDRLGAIHDEYRRVHQEAVRNGMLPEGSHYNEALGTIVDENNNFISVDGGVSSPDPRVVELNAQLDALNSAYDRFEVAGPVDMDIGAPIVESSILPDEVAADTGFIRAVNNMAERLGTVSSDDIFKIIAFETAGSWSPSERNPTPGSTATGLIQFLSSTAKGLGTTVEDLAMMSREEQMVYVEKYLAPYAGRINNLGDLYMAIHWPAGIGKSDDYVMYRRGTEAEPNDNYDWNISLDLNEDGVVTRGEAVAAVQGVDTSRIRRTAPGERGTEPYSRPAPEVMSNAPSAPSGGGGGGGAPQATAISPESLVNANDMAPARPRSTGKDRPPESPVSSDVARDLSAIAGGQFNTPEEAEAAFDRGDLKIGDIIMLNGVRVRVDDGDF